MNRTRILAVVGALFFFALASSPAAARDLAGVPWKEFKERSTFVFEGLLIKAEMLDAKGGGDAIIRYTYKVSNVFKGPAAEIVSFDAVVEEDINKTVGRAAIVALRRIKDSRDKDVWALSVDQRSVWRLENEMAAKDFHGVPVFEIPTGLLYDFPAELSAEIEIKVRYGDDYRNAKKKLFPSGVVQKKLKELLATE